METLESLKAYCTENKRVCPQPQRWNELWEMLPDKKRVGSGWEPPLPLILAAWWDTPAFVKQLRVAEHLDWANEHGCLEQVAAFVRGLKESDWFHLGD